MQKTQTESSEIMWTTAVKIYYLPLSISHIRHKHLIQNQLKFWRKKIKNGISIPYKFCKKESKIEGRGMGASRNLCIFWIWLLQVTHNPRPWDIFSPSLNCYIIYHDVIVKKERKKAENNKLLWYQFYLLILSPEWSKSKTSKKWSECIIYAIPDN